MFNVFRKISGHFIIKNKLNYEPELLLDRIRNTCLEAVNYQDMSFDKLVEELNPIRNLGQTPLFTKVYY